MAKNYTIDAATARNLLVVLQLQEEAKEGDIAWALSIIRRIPRYKKISIAKAAGSRALKELLIAIASGEISSASPKDLEMLLEEAEKRAAEEEITQLEEKKVKKEVAKVSLVKKEEPLKETEE